MEKIKTCLLQFQPDTHFPTTQAKTKFHRSDLRGPMSENMGDGTKGIATNNLTEKREEKISGGNKTYQCHQIKY